MYLSLSNEFIHEIIYYYYNTLVLLVAIGTVQKKIHLYLANASCEKTMEFTHIMILKGHEDWVKDLTFTHFDDNGFRTNLMLASASQDRYIRLWMIGESDQETVDKNLWNLCELDDTLR